jgi:hypothetical protein
MNMMTAIILSLTIITVIATTTAAAIRADARSRLDSPLPRVMATRTPTPRRRVAGVRYPVGLASPQYLPELERARILRARTVNLGVTTLRRRQVVRIPVSGAGLRLGGRKVSAGDQGSLDPVSQVASAEAVGIREGV